ncbi:MAG TPA: hypothetical protein VEN79_10440 [Terriglobia bacterium]|nr:hypothetical protein [Terriglobia bacterium]
MWKRTAIAVLYLALFALPASSRVLLRWTEPALPPAEASVVQDLVISWSTGQNLVGAARKQGYHVYAEVTLKEVSDAGQQISQIGIAGIVVKMEGSDGLPELETVKRLRLKYPHLRILVLGRPGKQPQMRGSTIVNDAGVLEVSSPTAQPWIDSNVALVAYDRARRPAEVPLFDFPWGLSDAMERLREPSPTDYLLAVAEAGALHADLIMDVDPAFQRTLAQRHGEGVAAWNQVRRYIEFYSQQDKSSGVPMSNVGVVIDDFESAYEVMNLMARRNIPFRVLTPDELADGRQGLDLLMVFAKLDEKLTPEVAGFIAAGGIAVLVNQTGSFPWHSGEAGRPVGHSVTYTFGQGKAIQFNGTIDDPETFAQDVRRLLSNEKMLVNLWNALTTLAVPYQLAGGTEVTLELINYAEQPLPVQVRVKGSYPVIRYENPEHGCCEYLSPTRSDGFTEFVVPWLGIGGRVHLAPAAAATSANH